MVAILKKILGQRQLKKAGMDTYGEKESLAARSAERKAKRQEWIDKGKAALKDYAEKAPERRAARIEKINQQAKLAEAQARLARAQSAQQKARSAARPAMGFGMGIGAPSMGMGLQPQKRKTKRKTSRKPRAIIY